MIIGSNDILYTPDDMKKLQSKAGELVAKQIYVVENPDRKDNFIVDKAAYYRVVSEFLKR